MLNLRIWYQHLTSNGLTPCSAHRFFLVDVFGTTEEFTSKENVTLGQRLIRLEDLMKATFFPDFATMQESADDNYSVIESFNLE